MSTATPSADQPATAQRPPGRLRSALHRYGRMSGYLFRHRFGLAWIGLLTLASVGVAAMQPWPLKLLADYALGDRPLAAWLAAVLESGGLPTTTTGLVVLAGLASLLVFGLGAALDAALSWAWTATGQRMVYDLAADLFHRLQRLSLLFHERRSVGDSLSRLTGDTSCVCTVAEAVLIGPAQRLLTIGVLTAIAWQLDPLLAAASLAIAPGLALSAHIFGPMIKRRSRRGREARSALMSFVHQTLSSLPIVQLFHAADRNQGRYKGLAEDTVRASRSAALCTASYGLVNGTLTKLGIALVLYLGGLRVLSGATSLGSLLVLMSYLRTMRGAWRGLLNTYGTLRSAEASIDRVTDVLDSEHAMTEPAHPTPLPARGRSPGARVSFEGVTFGYEPGRPVLRGITTHIEAGQTIAIVGPSGAGKSSFVSLIPRFYDVWAGRVTFDGVDVRETSLAELRGRTALVTQDPMLLPMTVAENIAYGDPRADRVAIESAAVAAQADAFIRALPHGYETVVGERGANLSGGQRQRIAIARAMLRNAELVILDEPTAALDAETEASLMTAVGRLAADRTTLIIAHRLSTIGAADRVLVFEDGRIIETGSPEELMRRDGLFTRLRSLQATEEAAP